MTEEDRLAKLFESQGMPAWMARAAARDAAGMAKYTGGRVKVMTHPKIYPKKKPGKDR